MSVLAAAGLAKIAPIADAVMEPWTMMGRLCARNRLGRTQLGIAVTDRAAH